MDGGSLSVMPTVRPERRVHPNSDTGMRTRNIRKGTLWLDAPTERATVEKTRGGITAVDPPVAVRAARMELLRQYFADSREQRRPSSRQ